MVLAQPDFAHQAELGAHTLQMRVHDQEQLLVHWEPQRISSFVSAERDTLSGWVWGIWCYIPWLKTWQAQQEFIYRPEACVRKAYMRIPCRRISSWNHWFEEVKFPLFEKLNPSRDNSLCRKSCLHSTNSPRTVIIWSNSWFVFGAQKPVWNCTVSEFPNGLKCCF